MIDLERFERDGFAITERFLSSAEVGQLIEVLNKSAPANDEVRRGGVRDVLDSLPELGTLAGHAAVQTIVNAILGSNAFVVRATLFDKTGAANWKVPWHQDLTIAVAGRGEAAGYGPWSIKAGVLHVQPPSQVLERMMTVRIHLDDCPSSNGALRVLPGTHRLGRRNQSHLDEFIDEDRAFVCEATAGQALVMRPLLLHASSAADSPGHRRVVHFDFATGDLADGLSWHMHRAMSDC